MQSDNLTSFTQAVVRRIHELRPEVQLTVVHDSILFICTTEEQEQLRDFLGQVIRQIVQEFGYVPPPDV